MIDNCNINMHNLAKNQVSAIFPSPAWCQLGAHPDGHQHGGRKPTETSVAEFCYKSVNSSLEELKNNTVLLFPMQELFRWPNFPKEVSQ